MIELQVSNHVQELDIVKLPKVFKAKWVKALRSGKYEQGTNGQLVDDRGRYCCLGVVGAILGCGKMKGNRFLERGQLTYYRRVPKALRGSNGLPGQLADANDSGCTFNQIVDFIEERL